MFNVLKNRIYTLKKNYFYPSLNRLDENILEVGCGKGDNIKYFPYTSNIYVTDRKIRKNTLSKNLHRPNLVFKECKIEELPFKSNFFDVVVFTFVLCSVKSVDKSIHEIQRVLKPNGKLIFIEHVASKYKILAILQNIYSIPFSYLTNCHPNRNPLNKFSKNNFQILHKKYIEYNYFSRLLFVKKKKK